MIDEGMAGGRSRRRERRPPGSFPRARCARNTEARRPPSGARVWESRFHPGPARERAYRPLPLAAPEDSKVSATRARTSSRMPFLVPDGLRGQALDACATEARFRQLQECNTIGIDVGKAAPYLRLKGTRGQEHGVKRPGGLST